MKTAKEILEKYSRVFYQDSPDSTGSAIDLEDCMQAMEEFASQDKWVEEEVPKDRVKIIRWHNTWRIPMVVFYKKGNNHCDWITGDLSNSYPEESFIPNLYQLVPKAPLLTNKE